jgi:predicted DNA-binding transcriptional regulator AlpA
MHTSLLRLKTVEAQTGLARSTAYKLSQKGNFPAPVNLTGSRAVAQSSCAIDAWVAARITAA